MHYHQGSDFYLTVQVYEWETMCKPCKKLLGLSRTGAQEDKGSEQTFLFREDQWRRSFLPQSITFKSVTNLQSVGHLGNSSKPHHQWWPTGLCGLSPQTGVTQAPDTVFLKVFLGLTGPGSYVNISEMRGASGSTPICPCSRILWFGLELNEFIVQCSMLSTCLCGICL